MVEGEEGMCVCSAPCLPLPCRLPSHFTRGVRRRRCIFRHIGLSYHVFYQIGDGVEHLHVRSLLREKNPAYAPGHDTGLRSCQTRNGRYHLFGVEV